MSESTTNKQRELLSTQENVENNPSKNSNLVNMEKIKGTPFTLINQNNTWFMVMGDWRITETTETKEEQIEKLESEKWLIIMHISIIALKKTLENPVIMDMDEEQKPITGSYKKNTPGEWESPRDREKRTRQEYKPIK